LHFESVLSECAAAGDDKTEQENDPTNCDFLHRRILTLPHRAFTAHATTNTLVAIQVLLFDQWQLW
jgi:lactate dehydrogenase-like 2-hydroxyacid dehydrogenase